jgi:hypothetical protein
MLPGATFADCSDEINLSMHPVATFDLFLERMRRRRARPVDKIR